MKLLLVGLGNIGPEYVWTRHNVGFLVLDRLALQQSLSFRASRLAFIASFSYRGHQVYLIKPTTYVNDSGRSVSYWLHYLKVPFDRSLTIVDDISLPFGKLRLRSKGSNGGHNGLKSINDALGSDAYPRLRVGIGSNFPKGKLSDFVLGDFDSQELKQIGSHLDKACEILLTWCAQGTIGAMNQFN